MSQGRQTRALVAGVTAFALCFGAAGAMLWQGDYLAGRLAGDPPTAWRPGSAPAALAVLPAAQDGTLPDPAKVASAVTPLASAAALGPNVTMHVIDVVTGQVLAGKGSDTPTTPASTIKITTAVAALKTFGPTHRFTTKVVAGSAPGQVVLVGAGDATIAGGATGRYPGAPSLTALAGQVKNALGGQAVTSVVVDATIFGEPRVGPWDSDIATNGVVAPITGLMADGGRVNPKDTAGSTRRYTDPDLAAGQIFAKALGATGTVTRGTAPQGAAELGSVQSQPLAHQVEFMITDSDNVIAESLARHVAIKRGQPATFEGGGVAIRDAVGELGLPAAELTQVDGSGLARGDRVSPSLLAEIVAMAAKPEHPELRALITGLAVAKYTGTLAERFAKPTIDAPGAVRAKTGTLRSVSGIAGVVTTKDGRLLAFAILADNVPVGGTGPAQDALDKIAVALANCGC
ncbi:D-alanyl-D-alanine carboxypeptidase [Virgisporangium aliadipatigenens]|uniref:D-alanyl-D-alanine carboxypeptidase n=1 Tax=Virgisporangium aliadipatigenens TaxID=741659 RepID=A0A8J3YY29_9ACTN|nr:D-alanyl-D-alanine carboxypeptidase/D-alanyl-D-alanine-endopeptidase [Virgisporangium aliadipatigenens]GIJ51801.1 D-alanyl-D-alanine carboxypeptidase [Virgisporangium aliadipatigenens]